jgi:hypothetical protein
MPDGHIRPAYTRFFASTVTDLSTAHWTNQPIQARFVFDSMAWSAIGQMQTNLFDEFSPDMRRFGLRILRKLRPDL